MNIIVVGSALIDVSVKNTHGFEITSKNLKKYISIPYSSKIEVNDIELHVGGSGHNIATDLAKLGHKVNFVGKLGNDPFSNQIISDFKEERVDTRNVKIVKEGKTGFSVIFFSADGERSIVVYNGRNLDLNADDIPKKDLKNSKWLIFTSITSKTSLKFLSETIKLAKKNDVKILACPSIRMIRLRKKELLEFIKNSDMAIMNEEEIRELTGVKNVILSMKKLNRLGVKLVVTTLGRKGSIAFYGAKIYRHKEFKVKIIDTTGCGDSFVAGFLHYIFKKRTVLEALKFANASAALQCLKIGSESLP